MSNKHGQISYTYVLEVVGGGHNSPILVEPHPENTTVQWGGMAVFRCQVRSELVLTVKWIRLVDDSIIRRYGESLPGNVLNIKNNRYLVLPTKDVCVSLILNHLPQLSRRDISSQLTDKFDIFGAKLKNLKPKLNQTHEG